MNFFYQIGNRLQHEVAYYSCSDVQIDAANEKISSRLNQFHDVAQASFRVPGMHVTKKVIRENHVLRSKQISQLGGSRISDTPIYSFPEPRPDPQAVFLVVKQLKLLLACHTCEDLLIGESAPSQRVNSIFPEFQGLLRYVDSIEGHFQVRLSRTKCPDY